MARYKLKGKHYLNVPGTEWEHKEQQAGGKALRKMFKVHRYLDPEDPADWNYREIGPDGRASEGSVVVATEESEQFPHDIIFLGDPTPDMEPLDKEAKVVFERMKPVWDAQHPIESLPTTYAEAITDKFMAEMADMRAGMTQSSSTNVSVKEIEDLRSLVTQQSAQITQLMSLLQPAMVKAPEQANRRL